ncbi:ROK family transcriptional regulator [Saccharomonospora sp. NPDC046836]|uniref:ROK family transcriptional regulator n=1 Tax=Saccharomonospora sp. NPDC046836 TaxID=3156921 RepID=UPI0033CF8602
MLSRGRSRGPYEAAVLRTLREAGPSSRTRISEITGLSQATISKAVGTMVDKGLLRESVAAEPRMGRPSVTLTPSADAVTVCGVQIEYGTIRLGLADAESRVRTVHSVPFDVTAQPSDVLDLIAAEIERMVAKDDGAPCIGVAVGIPGAVDEARRINRLTLNLGWRDVPIADHLERKLEVPVVVDHHVRLMALAEARYGERAGNGIAYLYVRQGVGLGVAPAGNASYTGGPAGEAFLGHTRVVEDGELCRCGARGCLETMVAEPYLRARLRRAGHAAAVPDGTAVLAGLHRLAAEGDPAAVEIETDVVRHLASALATVVNLFTPDLVLVGGIVAEAPGSTITRIRELTRERIFPLLREDLRLEPAHHSESASVRGAATLALEVSHYT